MVSTMFNVKNKVNSETLIEATESILMLRRSPLLCLAYVLFSSELACLNRVPNFLGHRLSLGGIERLSAYQSIFVNFFFT